MKNKGRKHKATSGNCKGYAMGITRPIHSMASRKRPHNIDGYGKKWWRKRMRGYLKQQHFKDIFNINI